MTLYEQIVEDAPKLKRGKAWCATCGRVFTIDAAACLRAGWPSCCGATVTVDSPEERAARAAATRARA